MSETFKTIRHNGVELPIHWRGKRYTHACEGADIHRPVVGGSPGVRLIWTLCEIDVPANAAYLPVGGSDPVTCPTCQP